jgi:hypothetical protein
MIDEIVKNFENCDEVPSYNEIIGAFVDIGEGFTEKLVTEVEFKLAILMDSKSSNDEKIDRHWNAMKSRWKERWS